jgi:hypothetical protein
MKWGKGLSLAKTICDNLNNYNNDNSQLQSQVPIESSKDKLLHSQNELL